MAGDLNSSLSSSRHFRPLNEGLFSVWWGQAHRAILPNPENNASIVNDLYSEM